MYIFVVKGLLFRHRASFLASLVLHIHEFLTRNWFLYPLNYSLRRDSFSNNKSGPQPLYLLENKLTFMRFKYVRLSKV